MGRESSVSFVLRFVESEYHADGLRTGRSRNPATLVFPSRWSGCQFRHPPAERITSMKHHLTLTTTTLAIALGWSLLAGPVAAQTAPTFPDVRGHYRGFSQSIG